MRFSSVPVATGEFYLLFYHALMCQHKIARPITPSTTRLRAVSSGLTNAPRPRCSRRVRTALLLQAARTFGTMASTWFSMRVLRTTADFTWRRWTLTVRRSLHEFQAGEFWRRTLGALEWLELIPRFPASDVERLLYSSCRRLNC